jgi:putative ABC transport system permease protein
MFSNYLKMAWKVLGRRRFFTFVSLFGIGFTLTALMIVVALVDHQLAPSYPELQLERTLELKRMRMHGDRSNWYSGPGYKFLDRYARDIPGVERMSIYTRSSEVSSFKDGRKLVFQARFVDAEYWRILQFDFMDGVPFTADEAHEANRVAVISDSARRRFFDEGQALGETIELDGKEFRVVGVVRDVPVYRDISHADIWLPLGTQTAAGFFDRMMGGCLAAFLLEPGTERKQVQAAFRERLTRVEFDEPERFHTMIGYPMTTLENVANELLNLDPGETAPRRLILFAILAMIAFMALPAINLVNINLSRIYERSGEIGVRKAFGAASGDLVVQFVVENVVLCLLGGLLGLIGAFALLYVATLFPQTPFLSLNLNWRIFLAALALATGFGLLSGVWPAWKMSRQHPVTALRGGAS